LRVRVSVSVRVRGRRSVRASPGPLPPWRRTLLAGTGALRPVAREPAIMARARARVRAKFRV